MPVGQREVLRVGAECGEPPERALGRLPPRRVGVRGDHDPVESSRRYGLSLAA